MAITASIALSSATAKTLAKTSAVLTVSNSGASSVNVTGIEPSATRSGGTVQQQSVMLGRPNLSPGVTVAVAASGTATFQFDVVALAPNVATYTTSPFPSGITPLPPLAMPQSQVYDIGAKVLTSDGGYTSATTASLTVTPTGLT